MKKTWVRKKQTVLLCGTCQECGRQLLSNEGGWIIADNVLWSGKVLKEASSNDMETSIIQQFNQKVHLDDRVRNVLFPVRDGMMVMIKN